MVGTIAGPIDGGGGLLVCNNKPTKHATMPSLFGVIEGGTGTTTRWMMTELNYSRPILFGLKKGERKE